MKNNILVVFQSVMQARSDGAMVDHVGFVIHRPAAKNQNYRNICIDYTGDAALLHHKAPETPIERAVIMPVPDLLMDRVVRIGGTLQALDKHHHFPFYFSRDMQPRPDTMPWGVQSVDLSGMLNRDYQGLDADHLQMNEKVYPINARARANCGEISRFILEMGGLASSKFIGFLKNAQTGTAVKNRMEAEFSANANIRTETYKKVQYAWNQSSENFQVYAKTEAGAGYKATDLIAQLPQITASKRTTLWDQLQAAPAAPLTAKDARTVEWPNYITARLRKLGMDYCSPDKGK